MTVVQVNKYIIKYKSKTKEKEVKIFYNEEGKSKDEIIDIADGDEGFIIDLLRNEKPIFWTTVGKILMTSPEDVGEGED
jgi:hypothetical protein